eukprot:13867528-Alexandrium_andersonii.AAC.1
MRSRIATARKSPLAPPRPCASGAGGAHIGPLLPCVSGVAVRACLRFGFGCHLSLSGPCPHGSHRCHIVPRTRCGMSRA